MSDGAARRVSSAALRGRAATARPGFAIVAALVVLTMLGLRAFVAEPFKIPSESMSPTLHSGDHVLVNKLAYRDASPRRGDLVVFRAPRSGEILLKRVVGLAGDTVGIEDGALYVDGRRKVEAYAPPKAIDSVYFGPVRVPPASFFAMGDNRADSLDSRQFGSVPTQNVIGHVLARIWPPR